MTTLVLQILLAVIGLGVSVWAWWVKKQDSIKKAIDDEDKKINAVSNADDTIVELDRLRNEPPSNRS